MLLLDVVLLLSHEFGLKALFRQICWSETISKSCLEKTIHSKYWMHLIPSNLQTRIAFSRISELSFDSMDWGVGLFVTLIASANAYSSGAPKDACGTLMPGHGGSPQDNSNSPYKVKLATTTVNSDSTLDVTLEGSESFKGFMLQVITF